MNPVQSIVLPTNKVPRVLARYAWSVLSFSVLVILWGAVVRATSSGNGCGLHWPLCQGVVVPYAPVLATLIELAHRATAGMITIGVVLLVGWTWWKTAPGHLARWWATFALILTLNEGLVGALIVLWGKTAQDQSPARAFLLTTHMANTLLLLAALAVTAHLLSRTQGYSKSTIRLGAWRLNVLGLLSVIAVAATGSVAALGDTLFPVKNLAKALTQDLSSAGNWLVRYRWTHPLMAMLAAAFVIWIILRGLKQIGDSEYARQNKRLAKIVFGLVILQFILGILDVLTLAPVWAQILHLFGADLFWIALVVLVTRLTLVPKES